MQGVLYKFLLLIKFEVNTVSYRPCFFHMGHKYRQKKGGSLTYGTDSEYQVNKIFIIPQCSNKGGDSSSNKLFNWWSVSTVKYGLLN